MQPNEGTEKSRANRKNAKLSIKIFSKSFHIQAEGSETEKGEQKSYLVGVFLHEWIPVKYSFYFYSWLRIVVVISRRVYKYKQRNTRIYTRTKKKNNFCSHSLALLCSWFNLIVIYFFIIIIIYILFRSVHVWPGIRYLCQSIQKWFRFSFLFVDTVYIYTVFFFPFCTTRRQYIKYNRVQCERGELTERKRKRTNRKKV